jgi:hypothetical protein
MTTPNRQGRPPTPEQEAMIKAAADHWRKVGNEAPVQALARVEEAAKQLVTLNGALQGLYLAVFAFSDLQERIMGWLVLPFVLPVMLWLGSLYCATRVFVPQVRPGADLDDVSVDAWLKIRNTYTETVAQKLAWLHRSHRLLISSFVVVLVLLILLVFLPAAPAPGPTQIIILTPTP